ncbi:MAG TPA: efflux RND transporter permease subunit [Candidatus Acidoferrales bacterium]|nr:efflux RND transporter permease subunit [Candidatus Acidoferrales bacterium]
MAMSPTEMFIRRPVMTCLVMLGILTFGVLGYRDLPVADLPNVDMPTITVSASLPGASPETMGSAVATPLEKQFTTIPGLNSMTSVSSLGNSQITLQFDLSRNIDSAALDVQSQITAAAHQLPPNMPAPPTFRKVNPAQDSVMNLALTSSTLPVSQVDEYAETLLGEQISMIPGVAEVDVHGSMKYAVRIQLDPKEMASRQIGIDEVSQAVQDANVNMPMGTLYGANKAFNVQSNGQLTDAALYRSLIVAYRNGAPVRLDQLGTVLDSIQDNHQINWINGVPGIILAVQPQPGTNTIEIADAVRKLLPRFRALMPPAMQLEVEYDKSQSIRQSVQEVKFTLFLAVVLVILVIFLFLRNASATTIPSLALPMSIFGTFAVMYLLGYSIDNLSMLGLTLSVGFVVDDAIVMLENIVRHMESGEGVMEAALAGSREIGFTIVSMTLALAAVFIPVFFMGGILGRLLHEFAVVIISAVLVSGLVSLTLTPMLCSRYLRPGHDKKHGWAYNKLENMMQTSLRWYGASLQWCLRHRVTVMAIGLLILAATAWEFWVIPKGFLPTEDMNEVIVNSQANQGISYQAMEKHQEALNAIVVHEPNTLEFFSTISDTNSSGMNVGSMYLHLKDPSDRPWTSSPTYERLVGKYGGSAVLRPILRAIRPAFEHHMSIQDIIEDLQPKLNAVPGVRVYLQNPPAIRLGGHGTKSLYQFTLSSPGTDQLYKYAEELETKMRSLATVTDVTTDLQIKNPQANVVVDRDKASALGVSPQQIENALYTAYGQRQVSTIYAPNNEYWVIMQVQDRFQSDPEMLSDLYIRSTTGRLVPLSTVSKITTNLGPLTVNHTGQMPSVTISFDLPRGVAIGQAVNDVQRLANSLLPITITTSFQGNAQAFQQSLTGLGILLVMAVLVIYLVLGILYESFIHPITILSGLPAAAYGGLSTLSIFHMPLDIYGFVGVIMLIGIVKKNAIMMVDFALQLERAGEGHSAAESIYQGSMIRFRPIMMTTAAAIFGTLPIALGVGAGADARRPLGLCVVGGLVFAQVVTLYLTPVFYTYMDSFQSWWSRGKRKVSAEAAAPLAHEPVLAPQTKRLAQN